MASPLFPPPDVLGTDWTPPLADVRWVTRKYLDVPYAGDSPAQCLDLYLPEAGEGPFPLLIHIHGGAFSAGNKRDSRMDSCLTLLEEGFAVASLGYRLSGEAVFPAAVLDCRAAVRFLRKNAAAYGLDPARFAVTGSSAGGNLAAMLAMNVPNGAFPGEGAGEDYGETPYVSAAVDQFGPISFIEMDDQARRNGLSHVDHDEPFSPESRYLGIPVPDAPRSLCIQSDPTTYAGPHMCPLLVQHGTGDRLVPFEQSETFVRRLREKGLGEKVTFTPLAGADHEDDLFFTEDNRNLVREFLNAHL